MEGYTLVDNDGQIVQRNCVFCGLSRKQLNNKEVRISVSKEKKFKETIKEYATKGNDQLMLHFLSDLSNDDSVYFHIPCRTKYYKQHTLVSKKARHGQWHVSREIYARVLDDIYLLVSEKVIKNRGILLLQYIVNCARALLEKEYDSAFGSFDSIITCSKVQSKLVTQFKAEIQIIIKDKMKIVASADRLDIPNSQMHELIQFERILETILGIRKEIYSIDKKSLPANVTAADVITGECPVIPPNLRQLVQGIICGSDPRSLKSESLQRKVNSMCYNFIHNETHGSIKTSKHMTLAIAMKSITSSRQVVELLNKFGHGSTYHVVEQLETKATYVSTCRSGFCPEDIELRPEYFTDLAFDNFDRFTETNSGKDTLHDTVGIIYQNDFGENNEMRFFIE